MQQVMLVVTDGEHNVGKYQPLAGADLARSYGLDVYAIGVGDVDDSQQDVGHAFSGTRIRFAPRIMFTLS